MINKEHIEMTDGFLTQVEITRKLDSFTVTFGVLDTAPPGGLHPNELDLT